MRISILRNLLLGTALFTPIAVAADAAPGDASFGFDLLRGVVQQQPHDNAIIAPRNIRSALAAVATGATGKTRNEILQQTGSYSSIDNDTTDVAKSALFIWVAPSGKLNPDFQAGLHGAQVETTPPAQGAAVINDYVNQHTGGMITHVIDAAPRSGIVLTTVLAFDGKWQAPFDPHLTHPQVFHAATGDEHVPFMQRSGLFNYAESPAGQIVQLWYQSSGDICMTIFLPARNLPIDSWLNGMDGARWQALVASTHTKQEGSLQLPKLKSEFTASLKPALEEMGMDLAFTNQAGFTGIVINQRLKVEDVMHVTAIDINEKGTKAAAATSISMVVAAVPMRPKPRFRMIVDRPYFITIGNTSNNRILFAGVVRKP